MAKFGKPSYESSNSNTEDIFAEFFGESSGRRSGLDRNPRDAEGIYAEFFGESSGQRSGPDRNRRDAEDIFAECFGGSIWNASGPDRNTEVWKIPRSAKAAAIESKLVCSLEELYKGAIKKMRISRVVLDKFGKQKTMEEILTIEIKPGWKKGTKITFPEKGNQEPGVTPADIIFLVDEKPHAIFKRDGNDLVVNKKISLLEALTGQTFTMRTLNGRNLIIPVTDIIKPGDEVVIPKEGMPISKDAGKKGNFIIKFDVMFPSRLTAEQKSYLKRGLGGADI